MIYLDRRSCNVCDSDWASDVGGPDRASERELEDWSMLHTIETISVKSWGYKV